MIDRWLCVYMNEYKITGLKAQKNKNRINVYINNEFGFGLERDVAGWLDVGQILSIEKIEVLKAKDRIETAYRKAVNFISYKQRTKNEVVRKLEAGGFDSDIISSVVTRLQSAGLVDDVRFAEMWINSRSNSKPRGRRLLSIELKKKGISEEIIDNLLESAEDELLLAKKAALKKFNQFSKLEYSEFKKKMFSHLSYRGFSYNTISQVVQELWSDFQINKKNNTKNEEINYV